MHTLDSKCAYIILLKLVMYTLSITNNERLLVQSFPKYSGHFSADVYFKLYRFFFYDARICFLQQYMRRTHSSSLK